MAQQREKEESELKVPKNLSLCAPPPIPIPPPKLDESTSSSDLQENQAIHALPTAGTNDPRFRSRSSEDLSQSQSQSQVAETEELVNQPKRRSREVNRCSGCRRKVGLTGFRCRCGDLFCSEHRYSDRHDCTFDYKAAGREAIARDNPLVRPAKILKV